MRKLIVVILTLFGLLVLWMPITSQAESGAITGYERVQWAGTVHSGGTGNIVASIDCPPGKAVLGGGFYMSPQDAADWKVMWSVPTRGTGSPTFWHVRWHYVGSGVSGDAYVEVHALCAST
jgi:hypothetical protein